MRTIATHRAPDADTLAAAWLAQRCLFAGEASTVVFVARDYAPPAVLQSSRAVSNAFSSNVPSPTAIIPCMEN